MSDRDRANRSRESSNPKKGTINSRPRGWKAYVDDVLARATSIKDELDRLRHGTFLYKVREKNMRGVKVYRRKYRLDMADLRITYHPNKTGAGNACAGRRDSPFIDLGDICEVRAGHGTDTFNLVVKDVKVDSTPTIDSVQMPKECCFSIIFKEGNPLDLVAESRSVRDNWVDVLNHLVVTIRSLGQQQEYELFLKKQFQNADKNSNGSLTFDEVRVLVEQLNVKMAKDDLKALFNAANKESSGGKEKHEALNEDEFVAFYYSLLKRPELEEVFQRYSDSGRMSAEHLRRFQQECQKEELLDEECQQLIKAFEPRQGQKTLSLEGFTHFMMFSDLQEISNDEQKNLVYQDMSKPLSHYYMASSHNTYLLGNQVTGESSVDAYINALKRGCRCVELDCHDGDDGEPIIYHGWTLTTKLLFREVISDAIRPYAFYASPYPLVLSIENHCSLEQQDRMADYLKSILGEMLFSDPVDETASALPSPESLRGKVLVKAKRIPPGKTQDEEIEEEDEDDERDEKRKKTAKKISQKLSDLVNYVHAVHFHDFAHSSAHARYYHMSSFGESKATKIVEENPKLARQFVEYNARQLSRIYPGAKRQDSSNLKPVKFWNAGCQIVALNYQTEDKANLFNRARFLDNGGCGFVLKPNFLRNVEDFEYSPLSPAGLLTPKWTVKIQVVSGQHIPKPSLSGEVIDPYVKVRIRGHPDDAGNKAKTEHVQNNGFNPVWAENFVFNVYVPQLAFLEFKVKDHSSTGSDKDIGSFCAPLTMLREGYRRVHLEDYSGKKLSPASLLVLINMDKGDKSQKE